MVTVPPPAQPQQTVVLDVPPAPTATATAASVPPPPPVAPPTDPVVPAVGDTAQVNALVDPSAASVVLLPRPERRLALFRPAGWTTPGLPVLPAAVPVAPVPEAGVAAPAPHRAAGGVHRRAAPGHARAVHRTQPHRPAFDLATPGHTASGDSSSASGGAPAPAGAGGCSALACGLTASAGHGPVLVRLRETGVIPDAEIVRLRIERPD